MWIHWVLLCAIGMNFISAFVYLRRQKKMLEQFEIVAEVRHIPGEGSRFIILFTSLPPVGTVFEA